MHRGVGIRYADEFIIGSNKSEITIIISILLMIHFAIHCEICFFFAFEMEIYAVSGRNYSRYKKISYHSSSTVIPSAISLLTWPTSCVSGNNFYFQADSARPAAPTASPASPPLPAAPPPVAALSV